jgi:molybdate transport system substrate-binding protein
MDLRSSFTRRAVLAVAGTTLVAPAFAQERPITVFAAASLKDALDGIVSQGDPRAARIAYAGSNTLAIQIENGAPAEVFISADTQWMDYLEAKGLIADQTRFDLVGNRLVLIAAKDASLAVDLRPGFDLATALGGGRLAIANVDAVPAGRYGRAALEKLGAWDRVKDKVAQAENVRAALLLVSRGEAPLGIVYATDAGADPSVKVVGVFPGESHPPIVYPAAQIKPATAPGGAFLNRLRTPAARTVFEAAGFTFLAGNRERS